MNRLNKVFWCACGIAVAGCARGDADGAAGGEPADVPVVTQILSPADGDTVALPVTIQLGASGISIGPATGVREAGLGHHHLLIDADLPPADAPVPTGAGYVHLGNGVASWVLDSLPPGSYRIIGVVAWGDHVPVTGARTDTVRIVVR
jgi:hypothetical protein